MLLVVAAIIRGADGRILLSQRPAHKHKGGCWEFPGGKVEAGEALDAALARELEEELGLRVSACQPFMTIEHHYPELSVRLCFREVTAFEGEAVGREGQPVAWFPPEALSSLGFPEANEPVVRALALPDQCLVLPSPLPAEWPAILPRSIRAGARLVYLRGVSDAALLRALVQCCHVHGARALVADDEALAKQVGADGVHLRREALLTLRQRPEMPWVSAACHDAAALEQARQLNVDMVLLSPVRATPTHVGQAGMGWAVFRELAEGLPLPVYALGGVSPADLLQARQSGARGVAGIRGFWCVD
ncbi:hypothetical protein A167_02290 [Alcanivorax sp. S71-1-4]|uniref:Nudix family hydrolase n=1 Tax=Alcanivorax sp. S71-1-4 TaxID=1177159 RepID=UPI001359B356|nr:Nudix family hydrolase [Alcanivorax sp. S71-1-4]KAF0808945.1 hypothetical protein A167_02290 [Alcanivorax sp. S71-1-4]